MLRDDVGFLIVYGRIYRHNFLTFTNQTLRYICKYIIIVFSHESIYCGYSVEGSQRDPSNEYPQHLFLWRNDIFSHFSMKMFLVNNSNASMSPF